MPHSRYERMQETPASFFRSGSALLSNPEILIWAVVNQIVTYHVRAAPAL